MFFFFSSRRRHTRFDCDWSSDVCSSDLFEVGIARRVFVRIADGDLMSGVEVVVDLRVDLLSASAGQGRDAWTDGKDAFTAAAFVASPSMTRRVQSVTDLVIVG